MHSHVLDKYFWDLPEELKNTLRLYMEQGVKTHIPQPQTTEPAKPSKTALNNREAVWKHLRRFTANGWVRAFPESCTDIWMEYGLLMHSTHFVEENGDKKERLVADLGRTASTVSGTDANSCSPDVGYAEVQADYVKALG